MKKIAVLTSGGDAPGMNAAIRSVIRMAGEDAVALGTDFDGFERKDLPEKLEGAERIELVWDAFQKAGITSRQTEKIAYGNLFRVIEAGCGKTSVS